MKISYQSNYKMYTIKKEKSVNKLNLKKSYIILYIHIIYLHLYNIIDEYMNIHDIYIYI